MSDLAVELIDVVKQYPGGRAVVLDEASLSVAPGEFVVLVGPSGGGKTTTLHLVAALDRPTRGHIRVHLDAQQNVEIVMLGTGVHRRARRGRAIDLLDQLGLGGQARVRPPELSGGERQRIAVARAFANKPRLVLADEPTGSLDEESGSGVIALLRSCCDDGGAVLAVSHDQRLTAAADRVVRLAHGKMRGAVAAPAAG
jgi:ABC-type lipoprotein export system ATPase subunit